MEWRSDATNGRIVAGGNGSGNQTNQLTKPAEVVIDQEDNSIFISDMGNGRVMRWAKGAKEGTIVVRDNRHGRRANQLSHNHRVMKWMKDAKEGMVVAGGNGQGNGWAPIPSRWSDR